MKYARLRQKLILFFDRRGCSDADFQADEAISRAARWEGTERIKDIYAFVHGVALNQIFELRRKQNRAVPLESIAGGLEAPSAIPAMEEARRREEVRLGCLESCLEALPNDDRNLLLAYYQGQRGEKSERRQSLAKQCGISVVTLRARLHRLRARVGRCCEACIKRKSDTMNADRAKKAATL
jgi:RNA polymerase sigma factor (sigma-70 family)